MIATFIKSEGANLCVMDHRLGNDGVDLKLALGRHCRG